MPPRKRLGQLLTELGVVDEHQLQSALGHQKQWGGKLGAVLVQKGFCKEAEVVVALSKHLGMPAVKLADATVDPRAVKFVSKQIAEKLHVFPYEISGSGRSEVVTIAMSDPTDLSAVDQLAFHTGKRIKPMLAGDSEIVQAIQQHYAEEKKPATGPVVPPGGARPAAAASAVAAASPQATEFPKRVAPPAAMTAPASPQRMTPAGNMPYIPPPIPVMAPKPAQRLEEIEPDESMSVPAQPVPLDLPPDDGQMMGLEPIAAHSQFGDEVAGQEEVAGEGNAADALEGLESAGVPHEGADEAARDGLEPNAAQMQEPAPDGGWGAATPAEGWQADAPAPTPAEGWSAEASAAPAAGAPADAFGAAQDWSASQERAEGWGGAEQPEVPAGAAWGGAEQPEVTAGAAWGGAEQTEVPAGAAWGSEQGWGGEQPAGSGAAEAPGEELPMDAIIGTAEAVEGAPEASARGDAPPAGERAQEHAAAAEALSEEAAAAERAQEQATAGEASPAEPEHQEAAGHAAHEEPAHEESAAAADPHPSADAPDGWASSEDPLGAETAAPAGSDSAPPERAWGDVPAADDAEPDHVVSPPTDKFALAGAAEKAKEEAAVVETEAPPEWEEASAEEPPAAVPSEQSAAVSGEAAAASEESAAPAEGSAPTEESAAHTEESDAPAGESAALAEDSAAPAEDSAALAEDSAEHTEESAAPAEESAAPAEESAALAEESAAPAEESAAPAEESAAPAEVSAAPAEESAALNEELAIVEFAAPAEDFAAPSEDPGELKLEGWVAPPAEPEPQGAGWFGQALEATRPLSAADLGTLASVGVDPNDGVGSLRLLATLVRILHRNRLLDPDELAHEFRESRVQAAAEHAGEGEAGSVAAPGEPESSSDQAPPAEPAET